MSKCRECFWAKRHGVTGWWCYRYATKLHAQEEAPADCFTPPLRRYGPWNE
jgi:hypothetical protein